MKSEDYNTVNAFRCDLCHEKAEHTYKHAYIHRRRESVFVIASSITQRGALARTLSCIDVSTFYTLSPINAYKHTPVENCEIWFHSRSTRVCVYAPCQPACMHACVDGCNRRRIRRQQRGIGYYVPSCSPSVFCCSCCCRWWWCKYKN